MEPNGAAALHPNNTQATLTSTAANSTTGINYSDVNNTSGNIAYNANNTQATLAQSSRQTLSRTPTADSMRAAEKQAPNDGAKPPAPAGPPAGGGGGGPPAPPGLKKYAHGCKCPMCPTAQPAASASVVPCCTARSSSPRTAKLQWKSAPAPERRASATQLSTKLRRKPR